MSMDTLVLYVSLDLAGSPSLDLVLLLRYIHDLLS
jgi:hypothetical protein